MSSRHIALATVVTALIGCDVSFSTGSSNAPSEAPEAASPESKSPGTAPVEDEMVGMDGAEEAVAEHDVWLNWSGSEWSYNNTTKNLVSPPETWESPSGTLVLPYSGAAEYRVFVHNASSEDPVAVEFQETFTVAHGATQSVVVSADYYSWDNWDIAVIPHDPVFHIKKGGSTGGDCSTTYLRYQGGDSWTYSHDGTRYDSIPSGGIDCDYTSASASDFEVIIENQDTDSHEVQIEQTRPVGTSSGNDIAWQIGGEDSIESIWHVNVTGTSTGAPGPTMALDVAPR